MKTLKIVLWAAGLVVISVVGGVVVLANLVDANDYKPEIAAWVKQNTGRDLQLRGDLEIAFFPWLGVKAGHLELSNREGFGAAPMLAVDEAAVRVKLLPLLKKQVEIDTVLLSRPQINLARHADGAANWDDLVARVRPHRSAGRPPPDAALLAGLVVQGISIVDGRVRWDDRAGDRSVTLNALNLDTGKLRPGAPMNIALSVEAEGGALQGPAAITLATTALVAENLETISLDDTEFRADTQDLAARLSLETMSYAVRAQLAALTGLSGTARRDGVDTRLDIPALHFNLPDESLRLPSMTLAQEGFRLAAKIDGGGLVSAAESGLSAVFFSGNASAEVENAGEFLARNRLQIPFSLPAYLKTPVIAGFDFNLADSKLTLADLSINGRDGQSLAAYNEIILPVKINASGLALDYGALVRLKGKEIAKAASRFIKSALSPGGVARFGAGQGGE